MSKRTKNAGGASIPLEVSAKPAGTTRIVDGEKQFHITTTRAMAFLFIALLSQSGWYRGHKEFLRARKILQSIGKLVPPTTQAEKDSWGKVACSFWISEKQRAHGAKCLVHYFDSGAFTNAPDDDAIEPFLTSMGLKDD